MVGGVSDQVLKDIANYILAQTLTCRIMESVNQINKTFVIFINRAVIYHQILRPFKVSHRSFLSGRKLQLRHLPRCAGKSEHAHRLDQFLGSLLK